VIHVTELWVHTAIPTPAIPTPAIPNPNPKLNPIVSIAGVGKAGAPPQNYDSMWLGMVWLLKI